ncbi:MAG TPA: glycosyltransferase family 2 protein [Dehalococcoidia bacterium]
MTTTGLQPTASFDATVSVVICALNEAENLPHVLPRLPAWVDEVVLVDGHSSDGTVEVARRLRPDARVLYQPAPGKGVALRHGVESARGDIIVTIDADGETDPQDLPLFIEPLLAGFDFAKGSRFARSWRHKPPHRLLGNWAIATTCNLLYGTRFTDLCSGYNAFWRSTVAAVNFWSDDGWNYEPLIIARALKAGLKVVEVPQTYSGRRSGRSKLPNWHQGFTALKVLARERFSS